MISRVRTARFGTCFAHYEGGGRPSVGYVVWKIVDEKVWCLSREGEIRCRVFPKVFVESVMGGTDPDYCLQRLNEFQRHLQSIQNRKETLVEARAFAPQVEEVKELIRRRRKLEAVEQPFLFEGGAE